MIFIFSNISQQIVYKVTLSKVSRLRADHVRVKEVNIKYQKYFFFFISKNLAKTQDQNQECKTKTNFAHH